MSSHSPSQLPHPGLDQIQKDKLVEFKYNESSNEQFEGGERENITHRDDKSDVDVSRNSQVRGSVSKGHR